MRFLRAGLVGPMALVTLGAGCRTEAPPEPGLRVNQNGISARLEASGRSQADEEGGASERSGAPARDHAAEPGASTPLGVAGAPSTASAAVDVPHPFDYDAPGDREPENDAIVAPPDPVADCHAELARRGVVFQAATIPLREASPGKIACGAHDAVVYERGPTGLVVSPPALVTCKMAFGLLALERLGQDLSSRHFGQKLAKLHQGGTYSCRKMARFDLVSEHSYGNAIDVRSFTLTDGARVSVEKDFGKKETPPSTPKAAFLREFGEKAFDLNLVSVSLGPYWDALHRDHFHFDLARYRVDGSRGSVPEVEEGR